MPKIEPDAITHQVGVNELGSTESVASSKLTVTYRFKDRRDPFGYKPPALTPAAYATMLRDDLSLAQETLGAESLAKPEGVLGGIAGEISTG